MDSKKGAKILMQVLTNVYNKFPDTKEFINSNMMKIYFRESYQSLKNDSRLFSLPKIGVFFKTA